MTLSRRPIGRSRAIDDVRTGTHEKLDLSNIVVRVYGDAAVATMDQTEKSRHGGEDFSGDYLFTDVWVKQGGQCVRWRLTARESGRGDARRVASVSMWPSPDRHRYRPGGRICPRSQ